MSRRSESGDWRSQAQFESRPVVPTSRTEHGNLRVGPPEACLDGTPKRDRRLAKPGAVRSPAPLCRAKNGARQPPSGLAEARPPPDTPCPAGRSCSHSSQRWSLPPDAPCPAGCSHSPIGLAEVEPLSRRTRPAHGAAGCVRIPPRCAGAKNGERSLRPPIDES